MKLLGLACGREMDNTEILVKEALMAAEELGARTSFMRLIDLKIEPCRGCSACLQSLFKGGEGKCVLQDDLHLLDAQVMECDGLILGSPVLTNTPSALLKMVCERFAPSHDYVFRMEAKKINAAATGNIGAGPDERSFKNRVGGFVSVGGGVSYVALALPLMNFFTFPLNIKVVDQMPLSGIWYGSLGLIERADVMARARKLGQNVASSMGKRADEIKWLGDTTGSCPVCHSNLFVVTGKNPVECPICGIHGHIKTEGDEINFYFSDEEQAKSRFTQAGLLEHWHELQSFANKSKPGGKSDELARILEKYRGYGQTEKK
ncbi:flavodoxin family protein [Chloroflexota bacterium]